MKIGLVGCGSVGSEIARSIKSGKLRLRLACVCDIDSQRAASFAEKYSTRAVTFRKMLSLPLDLIVEAASPSAARECVPAALAKGKSVMMMSTGALVDKALLSKICSIAAKKCCKIHIPSGAIVGLDGVKSADGELSRVTLRTTKPPSSLSGAPFFKKSKIRLEKIRKPTLIYDGSAAEAVKLFPFNVNVAASLSLVGVGAKKTHVQIMADPNIKANIHEISAEGSFGKIKTRAENVPSPQNPKTSHLAALSAIALLRRISEPLQVGT